MNSTDVSSNVFYPNPSPFTLPLFTSIKDIGQSPAWKRLERGLSAPQTFITEYDAELLKLDQSNPVRRITGTAVMESIVAAGANPREPYVQTIRSLKANNLKIAGLTNNFKSDEAGDLTQASVVGGMFDVIIESSKVGMRKPNPKIYEMVCEKLGVSPSRCVFLDDIGSNLKPAKKLGMKTIKVDTHDPQGVGALHQLEDLLSLRLFSAGRKDAKL